MVHQKRQLDTKSKIDNVVVLDEFFLKTFLKIFNY